MIEVKIERDHKYKARGIKEGNTKKSPGCATCGEAKTHPGHLGAPPSMNNHSIDRQTFAATKGAWERAICLGLDASGLPRGRLDEDGVWHGIQSITVEVLIGFEDYRERDEGNHRWMIEKALGDALVKGYGYNHEYKVEGAKVKEWVQVIEGGWLPSDSFWPTMRFSVGNLQGQHTPHESSTTFMIFPSIDPPKVEPRVDLGRRSKKAALRDDLVLDRGGDINPFAAMIDA